MASYTQGDTYPAIRGWAKDDTGELADLTTADELLCILKSDGVTVTLTAEPLDPPELDADGVTEYNWKAELEADSTDAAGTYEQALKVTWDSAATPPQVEYFPSAGAGPSLTIKAKLA